MLDIAISTTLISYIWIFLAALRLRYTHPEVERPYHVPLGVAGIWIGSLLITGWVLLGSWVAVFPGTLEKVFNVPYDFVDNWGVARGRFEVYTLATLGIILAFGLVGYWAGRDVRKHIVAQEGALPEPAPPLPSV